MHVERTADPHVLRWVLHRPALTDAPAGRRTPPPDSALGRLVADGSIDVVDLVDGDLFVHAPAAAAWTELAPAVRDALGEELARFDTGDAAWLGEATAESAAPSVEAVQRTVHDAAGALLGSHGGTMTVVDVGPNSVKILPGGACDGCSLSDATLLETLRPAIRAAHPTITRVELLGDAETPATAVHIARPQRRFWQRGRGGDCH